MRSLTSMIVLASACSAPARPPIGNVAQPSRELVVDADEPMGWIALAPVAAHDDATPYWIPVGTQTVTPMPAEGLAVGRSVVAIPAGGGPQVSLVAGAVTSIHYGCEQNQLEVLPLAGDPIAPGIAWLVPPTKPAAWAPAVVAVTQTHVDAAHATWTIGPVSMWITRTDAMHADRTTAVDGHEVARSTAEKSVMDGGDAGPIDLTTEVPGIPVPIAAYAIGPDGPWLVVILHPGYEGVTLDAELIGRTGVRAVALGTYLYYCAF